MMWLRSIAKLTMTAGLILTFTIPALARGYEVFAALLALKNSKTALTDVLQIAPSAETIKFRKLMGVDEALRSGRARIPNQFANVIAGHIDEKPLRLLVASPIMNTKKEMVGIKLNLHFEASQHARLLHNTIADVTGKSLDEITLQKWTILDKFGRTTQQEWAELYFYNMSERQVQEVVERIAEAL